MKIRNPQNKYEFVECPYEPIGWEITSGKRLKHVTGLVPIFKEGEIDVDEWLSGIGPSLIFIKK